MRISPLLARLLAAYWLIGVQLPPSLHAQETGEAAELDELADEFAFLNLDSEVMSASRRPQPLARSPSAITVLTREDIETSGARTLPEVLRQVPNMDIHLMKPLWYLVGMRGETTEASDTMLLMVDGRDVTIEFLGAPLYTVQHFSLDEVERIEVIRGPGSALYGANAYAGVVHVITLSPAKSPTARASIRGGQHGVTELSARGTGRIGPVVLAAGGGVIREDLWTGRNIGGRDVIRGKLEALAELGRDGQLSLEASALTATGKMFAETGDADVDGFDNLYTRLRFDYDQFTAQAVYDRIVIDADMDLGLYYRPLNMELAQAPPIDATLEKYSIQALHSVILFHNIATYGAELVYSRYQSPSFVDQDMREYRVGLFVQDEVDLGELLAGIAGWEPPPLYLTAGLRFDYNSLTDWEFSPRAALVYTPSENHSFRLGYAHAFLKPTFVESSVSLRLDDSNNLGFDRLNIGNPDLRNQTIDSLELGYGGSFFDGKLLVRLDLAYNWYRRFIWFRFSPDDIEYIYISGVSYPDITGPGIGFANEDDDIEGHNLDLDISFRPTGNSRLFVTAGYRQIFYVEPKLFSRNNPVLHLAAGGDLRGQSGWSASVRAFFTSRHRRGQRDPESILEPGVSMWLEPSLLLNVRLAQKIEAGKIELTVGLEGFNIISSRFREAGGLSIPNRPDLGAETVDRRICLFLQGEL